MQLSGPYCLLKSTFEWDAVCRLCIGCGGTHVEDVCEIGGVKIKGVQKKKKNMRVTYELCMPCA